MNIGLCVSREKFEFHFLFACSAIIKYGVRKQIFRKIHLFLTVTAVITEFTRCWWNIFG